ncbi:response regulator [Providencia sp. Me31A]|uniref:response regulator n=1 Tax=Providencia sp. Me31A TaxID=3392637 RepID=UPI003D28B4E6
MMTKIRYYILLIIVSLSLLPKISYSDLDKSDILELTSRSDFIINDLKLTDDEWSWLRKHRTLKVAVWLPASPPYEITNGLNDYGGINADYLGIIAQNLNVKIELIRYDNVEDANEAVVQGKADLVVLNREKNPLLVATKQYSEKLPVAVFNSEMSFDELNPKKIAIDNLLSNHFYTNYIAHNYPDAKIVEYTSSRHALEALSFGEIDLYLGNNASVIYFIRQSNLDNLAVKHLENDNEEGFFFSVSEEQKKWATIINKVIDKIPSNVETDIHRRWNGGVLLLMSDFKPNFSSLELSWIKNNKKIRVALPVDNMPINFFDEAGNPHGMVLEILSSLKKLTNIDFVLQSYPNLNAALQSVKKGESDIIAGTTQETIWNSNLLTTRSWFYNSWVLVIKKNKSNYKSYGKLIIVNDQYPKKYVDEKSINNNIIYSNTWSDALNKLNKDEGDAVIIPLVIASAYLENPKYSNLEIITSLDTDPIRFSFGISQDLYPLVNIINKSLYSINPEDIYAITNKKYNSYLKLNPQSSRYFNVNIITFAFILALGLAVLGVYVYKENKKRRNLQLKIDSLENLNKYKDSFIAMLNHEIRTPISTIKGMLELIQEKKGVNDENFALLLNALNASNTLLSLVNNVLDISSIENDRLLFKPERINLMNLVEMTAVNFETILVKKNLSYNIAFDSKLKQYVLADPIRIQQILTNILGNAIKFTQNGSVSFKGLCQWENEQQICVHFIIEDTGEGINEQTQLRLFTPFTQGETTQKKSGNGLGLYLSLMLAKMMQGNITLSSKLGIGTTVTIELILTKIADIADITDIEKISPPIEIDKKYKNRLSILIVDDNPSNLLLLKHQLAHLGHQVISSNNGEEAIYCFENNVIDAILTDCNMPNIDGFQLTKLVREQQENIPVFGMTADSSRRIYEECINSGMNDCLLKPISLVQLTQILSHINPHNSQLVQKIEYQSFSPQNVHPELIRDDLKSQFCDLQISVIDDTLKILSSETDFQSANVRKALHRLKGGVQLLGENSLYMLLNQNNNLPESEIQEKVTLELHRLKLELIQWKNE